MSDNDIFIQNENKIDTKPISNDVVTEIKDTPIEPDSTPKEEKPKKKEKKPLSEEKKQQLREQLKRGRETALKNRQKKAALKKIQNEEKNKAEDKKLAEYYSKKVGIKNLDGDVGGGRDNELDNLRKQLEEQNKIIEEMRKMSVKEKEDKVVVKEVEKPLVEEKIVPKQVIRKEEVVIPKVVVTPPKKRIMWVGLDDGF